MNVEVRLSFGKGSTRMHVLATGPQPIRHHVLAKLGDQSTHGRADRGQRREPDGREHVFVGVGPRRP